MQEEIYRTKSASIAQCELTDSFLLTFDQEEIPFKLCDLFTFRKKIMSFDIMELLECSAPDVEVVHLPHCDRFLILNLREILLSGIWDEVYEATVKDRNPVNLKTYPYQDTTQTYVAA